MVKLGLEKTYELLRRGRRPRSLARKLTPESGFKRVRALARDEVVRKQVVDELTAAGFLSEPATFEAVLASAFTRHDLSLFRRVQLQPAWGAGAQPISIMALLGPEVEAEAAPAPAAEQEAPAEASSDVSALDRAANVLAGVLQQAANSGAALAHTCLDCEICRKQQSGT